MIRFSKNITYKLKLISLLLVFTSFISSIQSQNNIKHDSMAMEPLDLEFATKKADETDWEFLYRSKTYLSKGYNAAVKNKSVLYKFRVRDEVNKHRKQQVLTFLDNYPQDEHYYDAIRMLYWEPTQPYFISKSIPDSLMHYLDLRGGDKSKPSYDFHSVIRALPIDEQARANHLKKTTDLVTSILNPNASMERKLNAEFWLFQRDFIAALRLYHSLPKDNKMESDYWDRVGIQFWDSFRLRMEILMNKYGTLEEMAVEIKQYMNIINKFSPTASKAYWKYFFEISGPNNPNADQTGIKALHRFSSDYMAGVKALKVVDGTEPLDMVFNDIDGKKIDLSTMRGKVVLIDFWTTYCGPCIKAMPHLKALYDTYRDKGFEVIGVVGDGAGNKSRVKQILKKTGANWPQRLEGGLDTSVSLTSLYQIKSYPTLWLLNKEGVIVDKGVRDYKELEPLIRKHLGLKE